MRKWNVSLLTDGIERILLNPCSVNGMKLNMDYGCHNGQAVLWETTKGRDVMANEAKEKTQIGWGSLGSKLFADVPGNERIYFEMSELHETWKDFVTMYGVKQYVSSAMAKHSFSADAGLTVELAAAKADGDEKEIAAVREKIRAEKAVWLKSNAANLRTALWNELQDLKKPMVEKAKSEKESKAQAVERARQELIEKTRASLQAAGMPEEFISGIIANL